MKGKRNPLPPEVANGPGFCLCGCGQRAPLARCSDCSRGWVKGKPLGYLAGHQPRAKRDALESFEACVIPEPNSGCHFFVGPLGGVSTYGRFSINGVEMGAHRAAWLLAGRELPDGAVVCHKCDTPGCVNLDHLFIGATSDNAIDMALKNRGRTSASGLPRGVRARGARFHAYVSLRGRQTFVGAFDSCEDAEREAAKVRLAALREPR